MFQEIISISKGFAIVRVDNNINDDILNYNVIFEDGTKKILGEIEEIVNNEAKINFIGEFYNNQYYDGVIKKPSLRARVRMIAKEELLILVGTDDKKNIFLGNSAVYDNCPIYIDVDKMFSNHLAIFGNTGSGKTYGVSRLVQNLFLNPKSIPFNSNIFIFNNTDEYDNAFSCINRINNNFNYKMYSTKKDSTSKIKLPLWLLSIDDYINLLDVTDFVQVTIIEKMLSMVSAFSKKDDVSIRFKNHLLASSIVAVMYSNQVPAKIRDQIFNILTNCRTNELNLEVEVPGVGYTRELRKCFDIDSQGQFVERLLIADYLKQFIDNDTKWNEDYDPSYFTLDDLEVALEFALISEGFLTNDRTYGAAAELKVKLHTLNNTQTKEFFKYDNFVTLNQFISDLILIDNNRKAQIVNFVFEDIDDRLAKNLVKIFSRLTLKFIRNLSNRGAMPIHLMLEEAHRYVQKDNDVKLMGYNIFERIAKEGRKFGLILDLISQRPTELSETVLSQCTNFLIFKINHPTDMDYIHKMVPNISEDIIEKQKTLQSGTCVAFGRMMKIPMIIKMPFPNPEPSSASASIYERWMIDVSK